MKSVGFTSVSSPIFVIVLKGRYAVCVSVMLPYPSTVYVLYGASAYVSRVEDTKITQARSRGTAKAIIFFIYFLFTFIPLLSYLIPECAIVFITLFCKIQNNMRFGRNIISEAAAAIPCPATVLLVEALVSVFI